MKSARASWCKLRLKCSTTGVLSPISKQIIIYNSFSSCLNFLHTLWICRFSPKSFIKGHVNIVSAKLVFLKLTHAQITILADFYSVDVIVTIVWGKNGTFRLAFQEFLLLKFRKGWWIRYNYFALLVAHFSGISVRPVVEEWTWKHKFANDKKKKTILKITLFFLLKSRIWEVSIYCDNLKISPNEMKGK